jgi:hypothetical protein
MLHLPQPLQEPRFSPRRAALATKIIYFDARV